MQCTEVGTTYFARLAARDARLMATAASHQDFAPLVDGTAASACPLEVALASELHSLTNPKQWLMALHLTCTYLAAKNIDKARAFRICCAACQNQQHWTLTLLWTQSHAQEVPLLCFATQIR